MRARLRAALLAFMAAAASWAIPERAAACTLSTTGAPVVLGGSVYTLSLSAVDTGDGLPSQWTISWGDGQIDTYAGNPSSVTHVYSELYASAFVRPILASAVCGGTTYFQNDLVVPSANTDEINWYAHNAATNLAVTRAPTQSGPDAGLLYPIDSIVGPDGNIYVSGLDSGNVVRYDPVTGAFIDQFATGGTNASGLAFGPDGHLYVGDASLATVRRYHGTTGAFIDNFVTAGSGGIAEPEGLTFGPNGDLYVSDYSGDTVQRYDGKTGAWVEVFTKLTAPRDPEDIVFGPDGHLYVASDRDHKVLRYDGTTGNYLGDFVASKAGGLDNAQGVGFGPDGNFYVSSWKDDNVYRFARATGALIDVYVSTGLGGIDTAEYFDFLPEQQVIVVSGPFHFSKSITVDRTRISAASCGPTLTDYPMLFSVTDTDLRHTSFGGDVTDLEGDDIVFEAADDATCGGAGLAPCVLDHEIEAYDNTTGRLVAWVRIPSVRTAMAGTDTVISIQYGNPDIMTATENPVGVWDANYQGVWHLEEDVTDEQAVGIHDDSTSNANDGAQNGNVEATGRIADGQEFDGLDDGIALAAPANMNAITVSAWVRHVDVAAAALEDYIDLGNEVAIRHDGTSSAGQLHFYIRSGGTPYHLRANGELASGTWYHVVGTYDGTDQKLYKNGVELLSVNRSVPLDPFTGSYWISGPTEPMNGILDEVRLSDTARSACWIGAEYENQNDPGDLGVPGFYRIGAATAVDLVAFTAAGADGSVELFWETGSELDNLGFHLYRATSEGGPYERITTSLVPGLGSSPEGARYRFRDTGLTNGLTYFYELEDIETTGRTERHGPVSAVPAAGIGSDSGYVSGVEDDPSAAVITYGEPEGNRLRITKRGRNQVVLELTTKGFLAYPQPDGSVRIAIDGFLEVGEDGLPRKRAWVEALAGRQVELVSVRERGVESVGLLPAGAAEHEIVASPDGVVELRKRGRGSKRDRRAHGSDTASIVSVAFQGDVKKALVEMAPLDWDGSRQELRLAKELTVTLSLAKRDGEEKIKGGGRGRRERNRRTDKKNERGVLARLVTREPGLYALRYDDLFGGSGRGRGLDAAELRLSRLGEPIAFHLEPRGSRFGPGATLFFVSPGAEANPYGDQAVIELASGVSDGAAMAVRPASPSGTAARTYLRRDIYEENRIYQATLRSTDERWMWDSLFAPVTRRYAFRVEDLAPAASDARLELFLQGATDFPESPDHHVVVSVNGAPVAELSWNGKEARTIDVPLPTGFLRDGENALEIENVGDTGARYSAVYLDRFAVTYPRFGRMHEGWIDGRWTASETAEISGASSVAAVLDVTGALPVWLTELAVSADGVARFRAEAGHRYLVVDAQRVRRPEIQKASAPQWTRGSHQADYLVVGPRAFLEAAAPLLDHRRAQGLTAVAVPVEEIYAELGFGESRPEAIRDFLAHAYHRWSPPSPRYVLLLGDATYDFKNYYGTGVPNRVPPLMLDTSFLWTASDPTYAAVNGDDLLPDLAIGRLPAANVDEVRRMVAKILAYETGGASLDAPVVLVSDNPDSAGDFHADAEALAATVLAGRATEHISLRDLGAAAARSAIQTAFDEGASVVSYMGHGGIDLWANESLLSLSGVAALSPQSQQPVLLTMNCLNGYFHFPFFDSLSEALVESEGKGAIAAFSPSGMSLNGPAHLYHQALLNALLNGEHPRLGDAVLAAQEAYAETGAFPELISIFHLLGDPTLVLTK